MKTPVNGPPPKKLPAKLSEKATTEVEEALGLVIEKEKNRLKFRGYSIIL